MYHFCIYIILYNVIPAGQKYLSLCFPNVKDITTYGDVQIMTEPTSITTEKRPKNNRGYDLRSFSPFSVIIQAFPDGIVFN